MNYNSISIYKNNEISIDFYYTGFNTEKPLIVTFTERGNRDIDGTGFAGNFIKKSGFDWISIKTNKDRWYQNFNRNVKQKLSSLLSILRFTYSEFIGYGSSMGAYAAIKYSKLLNLDIVIAFSPVYDIVQEWESRWDTDIPFLDEEITISKDDIGKQTYFHVFFDPYNNDAKHIEAFKQLIATTNLQCYELPFSSHPVGNYLKEIGVLKSVVLEIFNYNKVHEPSKLTSKTKHTSPTYLFWLTQYLLKRNKIASAKLVSDHLLERNVNNSHFFIQRAKVLTRLKFYDEALQYCNEAINSNKVNEHLKNYKDLIIKKMANSSNG